MKKIALAMLVVFCLTLAGCGERASAPGSAPEAGVSSGGEAPAAASETPSPEPEESSSSALSQLPAQESSAEPESPQEAAGEPEEPTEQAEPTERTATLYIGTRAGGFGEYPMAYEGELTPEMLIQGIADLTGWNLTLEEPVISGKGGMSVCLSEDSALFTGPPDPQKEEFHMYSAEQLAETALDSIQKTLQEGFTLEGGDPDALDIWYCLKDGQPLALPDLGLSWALDQPYQWAAAE